ncbi:MAG: proline dehydrogenase family protein [Bacteroidetes bacterium]|nr:proline dehydrogenase family protein [Bacteroidota bacterium]
MDRIDLESFNNTEVAFAAKSNWKLKKAYWLFLTIKNPALSRITTFLAKMFPVKPLIKATIFDHFCGGETINDSWKVIDLLAKFNVQSILDYSVEGGQSEKGFDETTEEIHRTIIYAGNNDHIPFAVFKVTGIAPEDVLEKVQNNQELTGDEKEAYSRVVARIDKLCGASFEHNVHIFVDAEDSWYQDVIDDIVYDMMEKYNRKEAIVFNTFQMYRKDMPGNLQTAIKVAREKGYYLGAKLVRGAYMEKERERAAENGYEDPICVDKEATDKLYNDGLKECIDNFDIVSVANCTHNEYSSYYLTELMEEKGIGRNDKKVYFSQLLGMSDNISFNLAKAGYNVAKYVPYGPVRSVIPYLIRRAEENTSVAGQSTRELSLIKAEIARRKQLK